MAAHAAGFLSVFFVATEMWQLPVVQSFRQRLLQPAWRINHNSDSRGLIKFLPASNQCFSTMSWWNFARPLITAGSCQSRDEDWVFRPVNQADCWGKAEFVEVVTVTNIRPVEVNTIYEVTSSDMTFDLRQKWFHWLVSRGSGCVRPLWDGTGGRESYQEHHDEVEFHWQKIKLLAKRLKAIGEGEFKENEQGESVKKSHRCSEILRKYLQMIGQKHKWTMFISIPLRVCLLIF